MPRIARIVIPGIPYHITDRGLNAQPIFLADEDYLDYLALIRLYARQYSLQMLGYCLMPTHIHLAGIPRTEEALAFSIRFAHGNYSKHYNHRQRRQGYLWHERFFSCPLDAEHLKNALRYIDRNPVRAGMVNHAWEYPWSSAMAHLTGHDPTGLLDMDWWHQHFDSEFWKTQLHQPEDDTWLEQIRSFTVTGRPLGSESFVTHLEQLAGRTLHAKPRGRPKKNRRETR
jgi:putative transposase